MIIFAETVGLFLAMRKSWNDYTHEIFVFIDWPWSVDRMSCTLAVHWTHENCLVLEPLPLILCSLLGLNWMRNKQNRTDTHSWQKSGHEQAKIWSVGLAHTKAPNNGNVVPLFFFSLSLSLSSTCMTAQHVVKETKKKDIHGEKHGNKKRFHNKPTVNRQCPGTVFSLSFFFFQKSLKIEFHLFFVVYALYFVYAVYYLGVAKSSSLYIQTEWVFFSLSIAHSHQCMHRRIRVKGRKRERERNRDEDEDREGITKSNPRILLPIIH